MSNPISGLFGGSPSLDKATLEKAKRKAVDSPEANAAETAKAKPTLSREDQVQLSDIAKRAMDLLPPAASPELVAAVQHALALQELLEQEFEALKVQDLDAFEQMQIRKLEIFDTLHALTGAGTEHSRLDEAEWDGFKNLIDECRELHRRNEVLIIRKLDAIRGTLLTLHGTDATASVEVYDRMGRISRRRGGRGFEEA